MAGYGKVYRDTAEKEKRFQIFQENMERIDDFNRVNEKSYKLGINQFTDLTNEEFIASRNGFKLHMRATDGASFKVSSTKTSLRCLLLWIGGRTGS